MRRTSDRYFSVAVLSWTNVLRKALRLSSDVAEKNRRLMPYSDLQLQRDGNAVVAAETEEKSDYQLLRIAQLGDPASR